MLEAGGIGRVAGNGHVNQLKVHDGNAFAHIVRTVAADSRALSFGIRLLADDIQLAGRVVELRLHVGESVDARDNQRRVLTKAVENDAQWRLARVVGGARQANRALGGCKRFVTGTKGKAAGLFAQQHRGQIAMTNAHFAIIGNRAGNAECLQTGAQRLGDFSSHGLLLLDGHRRANQISPACVIKRNILDGLHDLAHIDILIQADLLRFLKRFNAGGGKIGVDLRNPSFVSFK